MQRVGKQYANIMITLLRNKVERTSLSMIQFCCRFVDKYYLSITSIRAMARLPILPLIIGAES